jgi:glycosyltransferase involved in cell wall biosynthesis
MKILALTRSLAVGGAERQLVALANGLAARDHDVTIATFYPQLSLAAALNQTKVKVMTLEKSGRWDLMTFPLSLRRLMITLRPDVIQTYLPAANVAGLVARVFHRPASLVWSIRSAALDLRSFDFVTRSLFVHEKSLARFTSAIIVNSHSGLEHAAAMGYPRDRLVGIPNGIDTSVFSPRETLGRALRSEWGVEPETRLVGIVGRLDPIKGHATFLKAARTVMQSLPDVEFACVGSGPANIRANLLQQSAELGLEEKVIWAGERSDMAAVYSALDLCCSSSLAEGFSNSIAEAMACGVICVVTDVGDSRRIVGSTGEVVAPASSEDLASGIIAALVRRRPGEKARARVVEHFSVDAMVSSTERLYLQLQEQRMGAISGSLKR